MIDYYKLLGIREDATEAEVRVALKTKKRIWIQRQNAPKLQHQQEATNNLRLVPQIEANLLNPVRRAAYDSQLKAELSAQINHNSHNNQNHRTAHSRRDGQGNRTGQTNRGGHKRSVINFDFIVVAVSMVVMVGIILTAALHSRTPTARTNIQATYPLRVQVRPDSSVIRVLNIKPKFRQGMMLSPGKYHLEASHKGFETWDKWIVLDSPKEIDVSLNPSGIITSNPKKTYPIYVYVEDPYYRYTEIESKKVKILNIKPRFKQGIKLPFGKYHIHVNRRYEPNIEKWVLVESATVIIVSDRQAEESKDDVLKAAFKKGDIDKVKRVLLRDVDLNKPISSKGGDISLLALAMNACFTRNYSEEILLMVVTELIESGVPIKESDLDLAIEGDLDRAIREGFFKVAGKLIAAGAHYELDGNTLVIAAENGFFDLVKKCVNKGVSVNTDVHGISPLAAAVEGGHISVAKFLISHGAKPDTPRPIIYAARSGQVEMIKLLISNGADINPKNEYTPLMAASSAGNLAVAKYLVEAGADISLKYVTSDIYYGDAGGVVSALSEAAASGSIDLVRYLLSQGADADDKTTVDYCKTPLARALSAGHKKVVQLLLQKGATIKFRPSEFEHWGGFIQGPFGYERCVPMATFVAAAQGGFVDIVKQMLKQGARVNMSGAGYKLSETALMAASGSGRTKIVRLLLGKGASPFIMDELGNNALTIALANNQTKVIEQIKRHSGLSIKKISPFKLSPRRTKTVTVSKDNKAASNAPTVPKSMLEMR